MLHAHKGWAWNPDPVWAECISDSLRHEKERERTLKERGTRSNTLVWIPSAKSGHWELECIVRGRSPQDVERLCRSFSTIYSILAHSSLYALALAGSKEERPPIKLALAMGGLSEGYQGNSEAMIWNWKVTSCPCPQSPRAARSLMPLSVPLAGVSQLFFRGSCSVRRCIFGVFVGGGAFRIFSCCSLGPISPRWGFSSCTWLRTAGLVLLPFRCSLKCSDPASQGSPPCSVTLDSSAFLGFAGHFCSVPSLACSFALP